MQFVTERMVEHAEGRKLARMASNGSTCSDGRVGSNQFYLVVHFVTGEISHVLVEPTATLGSVLVRVCKRRHLELECHRFWALDADLELELDRKVGDFPVPEIRCAPVAGQHVARRAYNYREDLNALERILGEHKRHLQVLQRRHEETYQPPSSLETEIAHFSKVVAMMETERCRLINLLGLTCMLSTKSCVPDICSTDEEDYVHHERKGSTCSSITSESSDATSRDRHSMQSLSSSAIAMTGCTDGRSPRVSECQEVPDVPVGSVALLEDQDGDCIPTSASGGATVVVGAVADVNVSVGAPEASRWGCAAHESRGGYGFSHQSESARPAAAL